MCAAAERKFIPAKSAMPTEVYEPRGCFTTTDFFQHSLPPGIQISNYKNDSIHRGRIKTECHILSLYLCERLGLNVRVTKKLSECVY